MNDRSGRRGHWNDDERAEVGRERRTAPASGVPVAINREDTSVRRRRGTADTSELAAEAHEAAADLTPRVAALEESRRSLRKWIATAVIAAIGSLGAVLVWALNTREATGIDKQRLNHIERAVERLESYAFRSSLRRDLQLDPALWPAALIPPPAQKEPIP